MFISGFRDLGTSARPCSVTSSRLPLGRGEAERACVKFLEFVMSELPVEPSQTRAHFEEWFAEFDEDVRNTRTWFQRAFAPVINLQLESARIDLGGNVSVVACGDPLL